MLARLGNLQVLDDKGLVHKVGNPLGRVEVFFLAGHLRHRAQSLEHVCVDPHVPAHVHRLFGGADIVALVGTVAAQVAVPFLPLQQTVGHFGQLAADGFIARARVRQRGGIEPFARMLAPPAALSKGLLLRRERLDGRALRPCHKLGNTPLVVAVHGSAQQAADHDRKKY